MISKRITLLRKERGYKRSEVAKESAIPLSSLGNYERGDQIPNADVIIKLCQFYNVSADYLLGLSGEADYQSSRTRVVDEKAAESYNAVIAALNEMVSYGKKSDYEFNALRHYASMFSMFLEIDKVVSEEKARMESLYPEFVSFGKLDAVKINGVTFLSAILNESPEARKYAKEFNESIEKIKIKVESVRGRLIKILSGDVLNAVTCRADIISDIEEVPNVQEKKPGKEGE